MNLDPTWLALGPLTAFAMSLYFIRHLWPYRDEPGGWLFIATIVCEAVWTGAYGLALMVHDPAVRWLFEIPIWLGKSFITVFFLAFVLEYTGRGRLVRSKWMGLVAAIQAVSVLLVATNPLHRIAWSNYRVEPVWGAATVAYTHQPWLFATTLMFYFLAGIAMVVLVDAFVSYGELYRGQTIAVALSLVAPFAASVAWLFEVGPTKSLNLTTTALAIHLAFDFYAFFHRNMFEQTPAARRIGERAAIHDLGTPVVIVDSKRRVIDANEEAERVFDLDATDDAGDTLDDLVDATIDVSASEQAVTVRTDGERREYSVASSAVSDSRGTHVGHTLVFQDVTADRRRKQRLEVLNRVLRHNLRNDMTKITGYTELIRDGADDPAIERHAETVLENGRGLVALGEKAREFERAMDDETDRQRVEVASLAEDVAADLRSAYPDGRVEVRVPENLELHTDPAVLRLLLANLAENGLEHGTDAPRVEIRLAELDDDSRSAVLEVRDDGPGIPDHEVEVVTGGEEGDLQHGSGLGLWVVKWSASALGGDVSFDRDDGTTVSVRLPGVVSRPSPTTPIESASSAPRDPERSGDETPKRTVDD
ncbi:histidine kinase N-terminal 7TM domain-containing protein [Halorussus caseinilyticus]|uniref:histidine kinase n=1 Tax=Halorussus caseinilyticus TaxID=3034025 RepID=A0ABD5WS07_9EURY|nr:histidine kinase N-terminal 7TM domain-containing protein [Halorussus sp. DT72]